MKDLTQITKHPYLLLGAVRGPDIYSDLGLTLKKVTVRVRAMVFERTEVHGTYNSESFDNETFLRFLQLLQKYFNDEEWKKLAHYRSHLVDALYATRDHEIWGGNYSRMRTLLECDHGVRKTINRMIKKVTHEISASTT